MKTSITGLVALAITVTLTGCSSTPDKERVSEQPERGGKLTQHYDSYGTKVFGNRYRDMGPAQMYLQANRERKEPRLIKTMEQRVEEMRGVADVKVFSYMDNIVFAVLPSNAPQRDRMNTRIDTLSTPIEPNDTVKNSPDGLHNQVVNEIRQYLQAQSGYNILWVTTNPAIYHRVAEVHERIKNGDTVRDDDLKALLNDIGYTTKGYNLTS